MAWRRSGVRIPIAPPAHRVISNVAAQGQVPIVQDQVPITVMPEVYGGTIIRQSRPVGLRICPALAVGRFRDTDDRALCLSLASGGTSWWRNRRRRSGRYSRLARPQATDRSTRYFERRFSRSRD